MGFKCGIVGLPNVGKSTLFRALTAKPVEASNYPFCTIEPNVGVVSVPDKRLDELTRCVNPQKCIPAVVEFVDIAGLVEGAAKGEGLGNQFLANIRETQAILHVVRCFDDGQVIHVSGSVDPIRDVEVIHTELALADLEVVSKSIEKHKKKAGSGDKEAKLLLAVLEKARDHLDQGLALRILSLSEDEQALLKVFSFLTLKPMLYIANVNEDGFSDNPMLDRLGEQAKHEGALVVPVCAAIESELVTLEAEERALFMEEMGLNESGLDRVIHAGYALLGLETYFTAGPKEVRAWTIPKDATAPQAAGVIHTDFEKGFIKAEVVGFEDYITCGSEQAAKEAGKWRQEGKQYVVQDGDVIHFLFNV